MMDAALGLPDGNDVDQPMGPIVVNGPLLDVHGYPMTPVEVKEGKGKGKYKDNYNQGMGMPEASDEYDMEDKDDMDDIDNRTGQSVGDFLEGNLIGRQGGKGSQGPDEVAGKGNDKCNYSWDPQDDDIFAGLLKGDGTYWEGECAADVANKRARRLWAYCERTGTDDKCECTDIEKRKMFNEKARFPRKWKPVRCHWCHKDLPAEFLDDVVLVPLLMTHTQVPIVLEVDAVEKVLQTEGLRVEREMTQTVFKNMQICQEGLDNHGHNHSSKLTWFGEKLDATDNHMHNHSSKLDADMDHLKGNQDLLKEQNEQLRNMMGRMDQRAQEQASAMSHVMAGIGQLEYLIERIDQRLWPLERDAVRPDPDHDSD